MRKISLIIMVVFLLLALNIQILAQLNEPTEKISIIEVIVPNTVVYDDGIYRKLYSSFNIFSEDGIKLLGVPEKLDRPAKIKMKEGKYTFIVKLQNGSLLEKDYTVDGNQFQVISIN